MTNNKEMKRYLFIILFYTISSHFIYGQDRYVIVTDEDNNPIEFASVSILSMPDSTLISSGITNGEGKMAYHDADKSTIMRISALGYIPQYFKPPFPVTIQLPSTSMMLDEVTVKSARRYIKPTNQGIVVSMKGNPLGDMPSIDDAIRLMPLINYADRSVLGRGMPEIYINNRKVRNDNELSLLSTDKVDRVEIITMPGVKYNSDVKSVIIIHTKKQEENISGMVRATGKASEVLSGNLNADISYLFKGKVGVYGGIDIASDGFKQKREYIEEFNDNSETYSKGTFRSRSTNLTANMGVNYDISSDNSVGVRYDFDRTPRTRYQALTDITTSTPETTMDILSSSYSLSDSYQHKVNAYSNYVFGKQKNIRLNMDVDYIRGKNDASFVIVEEEPSDMRNISSYSNTKYSILAAKANYNVILKKISLDLGVQYSFTDNKMMFDGVDDSQTSFLSLSSDKETQNLYAGYANLSCQINEKWTLSGGLRVEHSGFDYKHNGEKVKSQSRAFTDLLPTLSVNFNRNLLGIGLAYTSNIYRPRYDMLNNNYHYVSHTLWETGNPFLKSSLAHILQFRLTYNNTIVQAMYIRNIRSINTVYTYSKTDKVNIRQEINLPDFNSLVFVVSQSLNVGIWHPTVQGTLYVQDMKYGIDKYRKPLGQITLTNRFDLPWKVYAYLGGSWTSKGHQGTIYSEGNSDFYLTLNKKIKRWSFNLTFNDIMNSYRQYSIIETNGVRNKEHRRGASRMIKLSITYRFNNKKMYKGSSAAGDELNRI